MGSVGIARLLSHSLRNASHLRGFGWQMLLKTGSHRMSIDLIIVHVIMHLVLFSCLSMRFTWHLLNQIAAHYSAAENTSPRAEILSVVWVTPQNVPQNSCIMLFRVLFFPANSVRSRVTPRYFENILLRRMVLSKRTLILVFASLLFRWNFSTSVLFGLDWSLHFLK